MNEDVQNMVKAIDRLTSAVLTIAEMYLYSKKSDIVQWAHFYDMVTKQQKVK